MVKTVIELRILTALLAKNGRADLDRRLAAADIGISSLQYWTLCWLFGHDLVIKDMSRKLGVEPATLVPAVDALERKGLLERMRDPQDRRRWPLHITPAGLEVLAKVPVVALDDTMYKGLQQLGAAKSQLLLSLLQELADTVINDRELLDEILSTALLDFQNCPLENNLSVATSSLK